MAETANRSRGSGRRVRGLLPPKHDAGTATRHYRAFWQRRCRAAAAGAVLKPQGGYFYINSKSYLYSKPDDKYRSNMYLIKGDQIKIIGESMNSNIQWYFINYKGKKEINMWIKADSVDLN